MQIKQIFYLNKTNNSNRFSIKNRNKANNMFNKSLNRFNKLPNKRINNSNGKNTYHLRKFKEAIKNF